MRKTIVIILLVLFQNVTAQNANVLKYIDTYKDLAISEMKRTGIPASITIAQGILETESGNSELVLKSNNHFGIKCKLTWTGETVHHNDDEKGECFRKYNTAEESYRDHSDFLRNSSRYASLFTLDADDYKGWAHGLKKAGYATNPRYPYILINSIEKYNLHQYTLLGKSQATIFDKGEVRNGKENEQHITMAPQTADADLSNEALIKTKFKSIDAVYVPKETSLLAVATEFRISMRKLLEYNDLEKDGLLTKSQWLFLERKLKEGDREKVVSKPGQSLHDVAQENAIQMEYLIKYNDLKPEGILEKNTQVALKPGVALQEVEPETEIAAKKFHEVLPKEGLYAISKKYNVSVKDIREWNNLSNDQLRVGQQLIILK